jgi:hypothetical protein
MPDLLDVADWTGGFPWRFRLSAAQRSGTRRAFRCAPFCIRDLSDAVISSGSIFPAFEPDRQGHTWLGSCVSSDST